MPARSAPIVPIELPQVIQDNRNRIPQEVVDFVNNLMLEKVDAEADVIFYEDLTDMHMWVITILSGFVGFFGYKYFTR